MTDAHHCCTTSAQSVRYHASFTEEELRLLLDCADRQAEYLDGQVRAIVTREDLDRPCNEGHIHMHLRYLQRLERLRIDLLEHVYATTDDPMANTREITPIEWFFLRERVHEMP